jgi:structure-specific endonuclease subunit SLX1
MYYVYLLLSTDNSTYVGATIDIDRRLRQHNKEIKGGAFATSTKVQQGNIWTRVLHITGFPTWNAALQFEWRFKQLSRKLSMNILPLKRRIMALQQLLKLDKPTSKAIPYSEWESPPQVIIETDEARLIYDSV